METLWETWEKMRWDGAGGIANYFRDYLYPLMDRITAPDGPFWAYDPPLKEDIPRDASGHGRSDRVLRVGARSSNSIAGLSTHVHLHILEAQVTSSLLVVPRKLYILRRQLGGRLQ